MDILFASARLERLSTDGKRAQRDLGADGARKLRERLDSLDAAADLSIMGSLPGRFHPLDGGLAGHFAMDLHKGWRLVLRPANEPVPRLPDGGIDRRAVTAITVTAIEDYHRG